MSRSYTHGVPRFLVERRLREVTARLRALREELAVTDEQGGQFTDEAEDNRLRALMSETPIADHEFRESQRHADAWARRRGELLDSIRRLEARQDELLDSYTPSAITRRRRTCA